MARRIYKLNLIKRGFAYDVEGVARLLSVNVQTVRDWIRKHGLPTIDNKRPTLIHGTHLHQFLQDMNTRHKHATDFGEMFCMKCKLAKRPLHDLITLEPMRGAVKAKAHCRTCHTKMNKNYKCDDVPKLKRIFKVGDNLELYDSSTSPSNTHLAACAATHTTEPAIRDLFQ